MTPDLHFLSFFTKTVKMSVKIVKIKELDVLLAFRHSLCDMSAEGPSRQFTSLIESQVSSSDIVLTKASLQYFTLVCS